MKTHDKLLAKWSKCEFGVKQRVFNDEIPQTTIQYILKKPTYSDEKKMKWIIERIDYHTQQVLEEIQEMYNQIESI